MRAANWIVLLLALCGRAAEAKIVTETVEYKEGDTALEGFLAYDDAAAGPRPGVLVIHDWMGVGPNSKRRAEELAGLGYVALAADIYGKDVRPKSRDEAAAAAGKYRSDRALLRRRAAAGLEALRARKEVDPKRVAAIGYCFGGGAALELARSGADLGAVVSFHGNLDTPNAEDARNIKAKVLVCHGADDPFVKPEQVAAFEAEMRNAHVDWQLVSYGGAVHGFTHKDAGDDPSKGMAYNAAADRRSWAAMRELFDEAFAK
jgi:dienelactone hydrolase